MTQFEKIYNSINYKVDKILDLVRDLKEQNANLKAEVAKLKTILNEKEKEYNNLKNSYENLIIAKKLAEFSEDDNKIVKNKIKNLIRDIDDCLAIITKLE